MRCMDWAAVSELTHVLAPVGSFAVIVAVPVMRMHVRSEIASANKKVVGEIGEQLDRLEERHEKVLDQLVDKLRELERSFVSHELMTAHVTALEARISALESRSK